MNVDHTEKSPTVLSICTGYGGIEKGLEKAIGQISPVAYVEIEAFADTNLVNKMETGQLVPVPIWTDLKTFHAYAFRGKVDILTGGYPCQPFSSAGKRKGREDPRHLWPWITDIIEAIQPNFCFFENVEGHISLGLREVLTDLVKLGYRVENPCGEPTWGLFSASEVGAPHQRKRVFILAYRKDIGFGRESARGNYQGAIWLDSLSERSQGWCSVERCCELENPSGSRSRDNTRPAGCEARQKILRQGNRSECSIRTLSASSDQKLANPKSGRLQARPVDRKKVPGCHRGRKNSADYQPKIEKPSCHVADTGCCGSEFPGAQLPKEFNRHDEKLADTRQPGSQRGGLEKPPRRGELVAFYTNRRAHSWPARPGEDQYNWEEPRTVADTECWEQRRWSGDRAVRGQRQSEKIAQISGETSGSQIKPQVGRAVNGTADRVDRLRLLGNGVVPQTAEKAFRILMEKIINPNPSYIQPSIQRELFG